MGRYEQFTPVIKLDEITEAEEEMLADLVALADTGTGQYLVISGGAPANATAAWTVPYGGTGLTSLTAYALIAGGTTATGMMRQVSGVGASGQILTSNGVGQLPSWQDAVTGLGDVVGPASATDNALVRFDSTTGKLIQASDVILDDNENLSGIGNIVGKSGGITVTGGTASGDDLLLLSTSNATKGIIALGSLTNGVIYDEVNNRLSLSGTENTLTIAGVSYGSTFTVHAEGGTDLAEIAFERHSDTAGFGAHLIMSRSRGTEAAETVVQSQDYIARIDALGHDGTDYEIAAQIDFEVDGTPGASDMPGRIRFLVTPDGSRTPAEAMRIASTKIVTFSGANISPASNDGTALGTTSLMFSDLFLASESVVNFNNGDVTLTHSLNTLTLAGGDLVLPSAGLTVGSSIPFSDSAGTLTLQNIDALDATTEATIESAIDTLSNLTAAASLGTVSTALTGVLRADAGVLSADTDVTDLVDNLSYTKLADGTAGQLITWSAAGAPATVATGTSGQVLTSNGAGAAPTFQTSTASDWTPYSTVVPTRASADDPTYVLTFAGVDLTSIMSVGMKIKWTQNATVRYGIITVISFSTNTTLTLYGGTDYDVDDTSTYPISGFNYSAQKAPLSFPLNPLKWTQEFRDTATQSQATPTTNTWYNVGTSLLAIPIGAWRVNYQCVCFAYQTSVTTINLQTTLSTANNSSSDVDFQGYVAQGGASGTLAVYGTMNREKNLLLAAKTTYYLNIRAVVSAATIDFKGDLAPTIIRATCAYL